MNTTLDCIPCIVRQAAAWVAETAAKVDRRWKEYGL